MRPQHGLHVLVKRGAGNRRKAIKPTVDALHHAPRGHLGKPALAEPHLHSLLSCHIAVLIGRQIK
jgi:hypothetical protein